MIPSDLVVETCSIGKLTIESSRDSCNQFLSRTNQHNSVLVVFRVTRFVAEKPFVDVTHITIQT